MSTKKKRSRKKQKVYTVHWPILMGLTALLVALVLLVVGVIRACALPEGDALSVEETPEPIIPAPTWSPLPVDINFTKVHNTYVKVFMQDEGEIRARYGICSSKSTYWAWWPARWGPAIPWKH